VPCLFLKEAAVIHSTLPLIWSFCIGQRKPNFRSLEAARAGEPQKYWGFPQRSEFMVLNYREFLRESWRFFLNAADHLWCSILSRMPGHVRPRQKDRSL
jgi:hypothetical protein